LYVIHGGGGVAALQCRSGLSDRPNQQDHSGDAYNHPHSDHSKAAVR
jgi:hypothetical protein